MKLYDELAAWWPLVSAPEEYAGEADFFLQTLAAAALGPIHTLLELGSGGGNTASHLASRVNLTLVDRSPAMLAVSRALNPGCEHVSSDMRTMRLDRSFDAVLVHDSLMYLLTVDDLDRTIETSYVHCRPGGAALFVPDFVLETFKPSTCHGGRDGADRSLRYLEWTWRPPSAGSTFFVDFAFLLREGDGTVRAEWDRHHCGLFSRNEWPERLTAAGFAVQCISGPEWQDIFVAVRPNR